MIKLDIIFKYNWRYKNKKTNLPDISFEKVYEETFDN